MDRRLLRCVAVLLALGCLVCLESVDAVQQTVSDGQCRPDGSTDAERGAPTIFGRAVDVPALHLRFVETNTHALVTPEEVSVRYFWEWLEYPYPEHGWGAWSDAREDVMCQPGADGEVAVPARTIQPRGWYDGKYTKFPFTLLGSKAPRFHRVELAINLERCQSVVTVPRAQMRRYENATAVVELSCASVPMVTFVPRP